MRICELRDSLSRCSPGESRTDFDSHVVRPYRPEGGGCPTVNRPSGVSPGRRALDDRCAVHAARKRTVVAGANDA